MTRRKKTRKTGPLAARSQPREERQREEVKRGKAPHRSKGKPAGQRHTLAPREGAQMLKGASSQTLDPRVGSKKPVKLVLPGKVDSHEPTRAELERERLENELEALENDTQLQLLLDKLDREETLSARDQAFVDENLARYQELVELLGIDVEGEDEEEDEDI
ncbi:MAG: hypothetical protein HLUCCO02_09545 [Idiomarinaceae bacterium HL-53]|nr:MAG: hypothetical protein HLUCCO02_09545 [Idiomarinaceae bacterium HL-53]CUS47772.1 hypothetical protein Ga0003345_0706 [Idiomarinaceae bacterium HL-53]